MTRLNTQVILVTGAATGIGKGIAAACVKEGAKVILIDIDSRVEETARLLGASALVIDITLANSATTARDFALNTFGKITGLVNNAGRVDEANILETSMELWQQTMALNLEAPFRWSQVLIPEMLKTGGGAIVNISTIEATHVRPRHFPYVVSKSGLNCLTRAIAVDFGRQGIRCNTISPGSVDTEMYERYTAQYPGLKEHLIGLNSAFVAKARRSCRRKARCCH